MDEVIKNPQERTQKVLSIFVKDPTFDNWDLICFCVLYLSSQLAVIPDLKENVENLAKQLLYAHYFAGGDFGLYNEETIQLMTRRRLELEINSQKVET